MISFQKIADLLILNKKASLEQIRGCSNAEIEQLENRLNLKLPEAYRDFLRVMGNGAGTYFQGTVINFGSLLDLQLAARELLVEDQVDFQFPVDAFVFSMHQGYDFLFLRVTEGPDPLIYSYVEGQDEYPRRSDTTFSEYMLEMVDY